MTTARAPARSASSGRRGCDTAARSMWSTASPRRSRACSAIPIRQLIMADEETINPATIESPAAEASEAPASGRDPETLRRERDEYYDRLLRKTAEFDNYRKRIERERRAQADQAVVDLLLDLLLIVDDFDLALAAPSGEGAASYRRGVELIRAKLQDLLKKHGVSPIVALGADFDP